MNEKTEELRDIFIDVADEETVTESQENTHGSLSSETEVEDRLRETVAQMRDQLDFDTALDDDELTTVVRQFYAGDSDADIADALDDDYDADDIARARMDLHLLRDDDTDAPVDLDALRDRLDDAPLSEIAGDFDADESTLEYYRRVLDTQDEIHRVNDRYRAEFENVLRDRELSERLTSSVHEDGLDEATEGQETDMDI